MNPAVLTFGTTAYNAKKMIGLLLATMMVVLALPFMAVLSMGSDVLKFLSAVPDAKTAETKGFYMGGPIPGDTYEWGNCTYWVYAMRLWAGHPVGQYWGNANSWDESALQEGYVVDHKPSVGSIFQSDAGQWGHVAYVIKVDQISGDWTISEMNAPHLNVVSQRTFSASAAVYYDFIHDRKGETVWTPYPASPIPSSTGRTSL